MRLEKLLEGLKVLRTEGDLTISVEGIAHDSRRVKPGDLFVALRGTKEDGHRFVPDALKAGASALLLEEPLPWAVPVPWVVVPDAREALALVAARFFGEPSRELTIIGITGTNGKTTTSYLLEAILKEAGAEVGVIGTVNYRWGNRMLPALNTTPSPCELQRILREMASHGVTHVVMEVSSHALVQRRVKACHLDVGIFTNLSPEHLDYHGTMEEYLAAKALLFNEVLKESAKEPWAIYNRDDRWVRKAAEEVNGLKKMDYGTEGTIRPLRWRTDLEGIEAVIDTPRGILEVSSSLIGPFNLENIMAAVASALALGVSSDAIVLGIEKVRGIPGRMERVGRRPAVFVDYAHTPDALEKVLSGIKPLVRGRLIVVFGCGGERDRSKRPLMGQVASKLASRVVVTSDNPRGEDPLKIIEEIRKGLEPGTDHLIIPDRREAIRKAIEEAKPEDVVVIAGKGHENYQIVGEQRLPFDDRFEARRVLEELGWS